MAQLTVGVVVTEVIRVVELVSIIKQGQLAVVAVTEVQVTTANILAITNSKLNSTLTNFINPSTAIKVVVILTYLQVHCQVEGVHRKDSASHSQ